MFHTAGEAVESDAPSLVGPSHDRNRGIDRNGASRDDDESARNRANLECLGAIVRADAGIVRSDADTVCRSEINIVM